MVVVYHQVITLCFVIAVLAMQVYEIRKVIRTSKCENFVSIGPHLKYWAKRAYMSLDTTLAWFSVYKLITYGSILECPAPLGMENWSIPDYAIAASSQVRNITIKNMAC